MSQAWAERAAALKADNAAKERVKGSGYHDQDRNPVRPELWMAPQRNGLPRVSTHAVAVDDEWDYHFVGDCAGRVAGEVKTWADAAETALKKTESGWHAAEPSLKKAIRLAQTCRVAEVEGLPRLTIRKAQWQDFLLALERAGVGVSCISADPAAMSD